jgi:hypothetical protein
MSYTRYGSSGHYIYCDNHGYINFDTVEVPGDTVDIFLYKLSEYRPEELKQRIQHGKELCDKWVKKVAEFENRFSGADEFPDLWDDKV